MLLWILAFGSAACAASGSARPPAPEDSRLIVVTTDGFRWQEVFGGAQEDLLQGKKLEAARAEFWRETPDLRRSVLLPFLWGTMAREGQIFGNPERASLVRVTNGLWFSYPGYSELFSGVVDPRIVSNKKIPNPNVNVFEWLRGRPRFRESVWAVCSWDVFSSILNAGRSGLPLIQGWEPPEPEDVLARIWRSLPRIWEDNCYDALVQQAALRILRERRPRVLYVAFGETDEWAHLGRYDLYLSSARTVDRFVEELWKTAQSLPEYRGRTSLLLTTDHGRGNGPKWTDHGTKVPEAERIWLAVLGPRTPARGEREGTAPLTQSQVASTLAALVGEDFQEAVPAAAGPIRDVLGR